MSFSSTHDGLWRRSGRSFRVALLSVALLGLSRTALAMADGPEGGSGKVRVEGVVVRPADSERRVGKEVVVLVGEKSGGRRRLELALPVGAGAKASGRAAWGGQQEVDKSFIGQSERYDRWARKEHREVSLAADRGTVVLEQAVSRLEISCPSEVQAGGKITVEVSGAGDVDDTWDVWLVYPSPGDNPGEGLSPDGSRYDKQTLKTGSKAVQGKKLTATFNTYAADKGRLLGVCIVRREGGEKRVIWVKVK